MEYTTYLTNKSRFCYNYKPPGFIQPCCTPIVCASSEYLSSLSCQANVININSQTTEQSLLLAKQNEWYKYNLSTTISQQVQSTIDNISIIESTIQGELDMVRSNRYLPYKPYIPPMIPSSVTELLMRTANAGLPTSTGTIMRCKGNQSVTT
jgi:hypothetical protein